MVESLLGVDPTESYGKNTKSLIQDFIDLAIKPTINRFFKIIPHNYLLFPHIIVLFYNIFDFVLKQRKNLENFSKISVFIFIKKFQFFRSMTLYIFMS